MGLHLLPHQRRELAQRSLTTKNLPKLAREYGISESAAFRIRQKWVIYQELKEFFADLVNKMGVED